MRMLLHLAPRSRKPCHKSGRACPTDKGLLASSQWASSIALYLPPSSQIFDMSRRYSYSSRPLFFPFGPQSRRNQVFAHQHRHIHGPTANFPITPSHVALALPSFPFFLYCRYRQPLPPLYSLSRRISFSRSYSRSPLATSLRRRATVSTFLCRPSLCHRVLFRDLAAVRVRPGKKT
jgi:hypothetical protein